MRFCPSEKVKQPFGMWIHEIQNLFSIGSVTSVFYRLIGIKVHFESSNYLPRPEDRRVHNYEMFTPIFFWAADEERTARPRYVLMNITQYCKQENNCRLVSGEYLYNCECDSVRRQVLVFR